MRPVSGDEILRRDTKLNRPKCQSFIALAFLEKKASKKEAFLESTQETASDFETRHNARQTKFQNVIFYTEKALRLPQY